MNRFKFAVGPGLFREYSQLFSNLESALLALDEYARLYLVPGGHAPWKPFVGRPANETTKFRAELTGRPWEVVKVFSYRDKEESETWIAEFHTHGDAFIFAQEKTRLAKRYGVSSEKYFVCLRGWTEDSRQPELARMPADHLAKLFQAKRRSDSKRRSV